MRDRAGKTTVKLIVALIILMLAAGAVIVSNEHKPFELRIDG